jgi:hypothetical protein
VNKGTIAILGSGETAPGMVKVHRELLGSISDVHAIALEAPFGFQENVPQLTEKIVDYFQKSLHVAIEPSTFTSFERASELERESFRQLVRSANYVFAGPGSPSYAMRQWGPVGLAGELRHVLDLGGVVCFSSAAALTLGAFTAPLYEIYKVGEPPCWIPGLNVLETAGLNCAVIPHFDNAEGGNHDTRFCYLGETRLLLLESQLDAGIGTLGVDEHTAAIIDIEADIITVMGKSNAYWRIGGNQRTLENGTTTALSEIRNAAAPPKEHVPIVEVKPSSPEQLGEVVASGGPDSLSALAQLVAMATTGGTDFIDPTIIVEGVLDARKKAREAGQYQLADDLRNALVASGIEVKDTPAGATWSLTS